MNRLILVILVLACALTSPAPAQICCQAGCVQDANRCVTTGPNPRSCNTVPCATGSGGSSGGSSGGGTPVRGPITGPVGPQCGTSNPTQAQVDAATNKCVNDLTTNAQFWGCLFEDDAGKAEDARTGLSCPDRQAALAKQCRKRCANFASFSTRTWCVGRDPNSVWQMFFGDIEGDTIGSARVERCGPPLRDKCTSVACRGQAPQRFHP
jgi:hypothetical protein